MRHQEGCPVQGSDMQRHKAVRYAGEARNNSEWLECELYGGSHERPHRASEAMPNPWGLYFTSTG